MPMTLERTPSSDPAVGARRRQIAVLVDRTIDEAAARDLATALGVADAPDRSRIAVRSAGARTLPGGRAYASECLPFTRDHVVVADRLVAVARRSGEACFGLAIQSAVDELPWSADPSVERLLVVAGSEPFDEGPVDPGAALALAEAAGIEVRLRYCGDPGHWAASTWSA